jgi:Flp pilus assembly protein TadB
MTSMTLVAGVSGSLVVLGLVLVLVGMRGSSAPVGPSAAPRRQGRGRTTQWRRWRWVVAVAVGAGAWLLTGLPVAGPIAALAVIGLPGLVSTSTEASRRIDRIEAVEEWTRRLADVLAVGVGIEQAIIVSVRTVPEPIRSEVTRLGARLQARWDTEVALRAYADDLNDPIGDLVVAALILAQRRRGPGLAGALTAIANSVSEEVAARRRVEADRAKPRTTARWVTIITLGTIVVGSLNTTYMAPYSTPVGQLVLLAVAIAYAGALFWMKSLTLGTTQVRLLRPADVGSDA